MDRYQEFVALQELGKAYDLAGLLLFALATVIVMAAIGCAIAAGQIAKSHRKLDEIERRQRRTIR